MANDICSIDGCDKSAKQRGWCWAHYMRWHRHGDPEFIVRQCATCGVGFRTTTARYKYCPEHTQVAERLTRSATLRSLRLKCLMCGELCEPSKGSRKRRLCTARCRRMYYYYGEGGRDRYVLCRRCSKPIDLYEPNASGFLPHKSVKTCKDCVKPKRYPLTVHDLADLYGPNCQLCHKPVDFTKKGPHGDSPTVDHIIPWALGGSNTAENLQLACRRCNVGKGARLIA